MTDYTKATNFTSKDTLPVGDAQKKVKGSEIDDEFDAISTAIASKANITSPILDGTPKAPTPNADDNSTNIATTAYVQTELGQSGWVGTAQIADDAVTADKVADGAIATAAIADDAVTGDKIVDGVALAGNPTATTQSASNSSTRIATTAYVTNAVDAVGPIVGNEAYDTNTNGLSITARYGPTGNLLVIASGARKAETTPGTQSMTFTLKKGSSSVRSETLHAFEFDGRQGGISATLMYNDTGTAGATQAFTMQTSGDGSHEYNNIAYIGF